ncbi:Tim10/DDP family zinc finger protein [Nemania serpens]|nr:Tim10/DDP family zinc finger protein [Nemania serpens]
MDNVQVSNADLEKLSDKDKSELQQFFQNESTKARVANTVHSLTNMCFRKCVTGIKSGKLEKNEESCMTNCAERFFDVTELTVQHLGERRS